MKLGPRTLWHPIRHLKSRIRYRLWHYTAGISTVCTPRIVWRSLDKRIFPENQIDNAAY